MVDERNQQAYQITWLIRRLFRAMASESNRDLAGTELSAADRAVMEFLYPDIELSVPEIARRYDVSRQHVQVTVNALVARGLLRNIENPKHKRSRLTRLSALGRNTCEATRRNETTVVERLFDRVSDDALRKTHATLTELLRKLT